MKTLTLLGAAGLAASLMAAPAFAQNNGNNNLNNPSSYNNGRSFGHSWNGNGNNNAGFTGNTNNVVGNGHYANVGTGSYTATQDFIHNGNGNNNNGNNGGGVFGNNNNGNNNNWRPSQRNSDLADNGDARASKVIGTGVYNTNNQQLGSVNDILIGSNGVYAVISTNNKKVAVPFNQLKFGNATNEGNDKIVLPNETQARLNTMPVFHYNETNYQGSNANANNNRGNYNGNGNGVFGNNNGWHGNGGGPFSNNGNNNNGNNGNNNNG